MRHHDRSYLGGLSTLIVTDRNWFVVERKRENWWLMLT